MMVSFQLTVFCQPQLEVCHRARFSARQMTFSTFSQWLAKKQGVFAGQYVDLGENSNCRKAREAADDWSVSSQDE